MIQVFKSDEEYVKWLDGQTLPSGIVVYVSDDETMYFSTNNIKGELKTYKCEKEEPIQPIQPNKLIYSTKSAGSKIKVNGEAVTLEQGDNIVLDYPNEITNIKAAFNTALVSITIPETVTSIDKNAFYGCSALTSVALPSGVTSIGSQAFYDCSKLTDFKYNGTMSQWASITLGTDWKNNAPFTVVHCTDGDVTLEEPIQYPPLIYSTNATGSTITVNGETVTLEQGDNIELNYPNKITSVKATKNTALTNIQIPNTVTSIEDDTTTDGAFYDCSALTSVTLPDTMTMIGKNAFSGCTALSSITFPENIKDIGIGAFCYCISLSSVTIPEGVTIIRPVTFNQCYALTSVSLPNSLISLDKQAFSSCTALSSITIPEGVTSIGENAFSGCSALTSVALPNSLVSISKSAFVQCEALVSITIPSGVTSIGDSAFNSCKSLLSITIPNSVTKIDGYAFANCSKLTDFKYNGTMSQWASITKGFNWNYHAAFTLVHCTDGDLTL